MKKLSILFALLCFISIATFGQSNTNNSVTGTITEVRAYNDQYAMTIGNTTLVLIFDRKDETGTSFEVNKEYKDILVKKDGKFELNPTYLNKTFTIVYYVNGKGWKCIKTIEAAGK
jgi:hypothetical protein